MRLSIRKISQSEIIDLLVIEPDMIQAEKLKN